MAPSRTLFIGMDVHKDTMAVAYVAQDHGAEVPSLGPMGTRQGEGAQLLRTRQAKATHLLFVSEAGPCGYGLYRYRRKKDYECWGGAPSLIPKKAGDRVKTDRRDARPLARLARSGARTAVSGPQGHADAMRDRTRARADALSDRQDATFRLQAFGLRHDLRDTGRAHGGPAHLRWLSAVVWPPPTQPIVLQQYGRAVQEHTEGLPRLEPALHEHGHAWRLSPVVEALQAVRGVPGTVAVPLIAALGALTRFDTPRALMPFLGLPPSASSSGAQRRQGAMTKAGNTHARRVLVEGAWASR